MSSGLKAASSTSLSLTAGEGRHRSLSGARAQAEGVVAINEEW